MDTRPIVLFLDELNRARPEILQSVHDLALNRTLAGKRLPEGSIVVSAVNAAGESANSSEVSATPNLPPVAPTALVATPGANQVSLSWTGSAGATSYNIKRSTTSGAEVTIASSGTTS